jgi:putative flippase GtrA
VRALAPSHALSGTNPPAVEIVVPVRDEVRVLEASIRRLHDYLESRFPFSSRITIADNGSCDGTWELAQTLAKALGGVEAIRIGEPGRGRALRAVWSHSDAAVLAYMDADLSTDLSALLPLVAPLLSGHSDLAIGSRLTRGARVVRGRKRELISRSYNMLLHAVLHARFSDAQCGFKAIRADRAHELLPFIRDEAWFFDTELLVLAERRQLRIHEVPVDWVEDPDSRVEILATAAADLRGVARLARELVTKRDRLLLEPSSRNTRPPFNAQVLRFAIIGAVSTLAYALLYLALRPLLAAQADNVLTLFATAVANTAANRRFTFAIRGRHRVLQHQVQGLAVFALALGITSGSLALLTLLDASASHATELAVLIAANLLATVLRFVLLRAWVFHSRRSPPLVPEGPS